MNHWKLKTPVAFLIFNRPGTTAKVFEKIREAQPSVLLVVADGPRKNHPYDGENCKKVRAIIEGVDWECEVRKNYAGENLGCRDRVSSGLDWVFSMVEEAIILEDDCLPHPTFFRYCEELLGRYRYDERISHVSGTNLLFGKERMGYSYHFSLYGYIWGWASWRRSWIGYDVNMTLWPEIRNGGWLQDILGNERFVRHWQQMFEKAYQHGIDTWDYQWVFHCWANHRLAILPNVNLISNIGSGENATHPTQKSPWNNLKADSMTFPLAHPPFIVRDSVSDDQTESKRHQTQPLLMDAFRHFKRFIWKWAFRAFHL